MQLGTLLILLLVLACPLMMVLMHRGGHGSHSERFLDRGDAETGGEPPAALDELRRRRDQLDAEIERLEHAEPKTPVNA